jgi:hypothetical protein
MNPYRFEIVRRANGRFAWVFVRVDNRGRQRVLARSARSWRRRKRARRAIKVLRDAPIRRVYDYSPFSLPATSFELVPGVLPLLVEHSPVVQRRAVARRRAAGQQAIEARETAAADRSPAAAAAKASPPAASRRGGRKKTT